MRLVSLHYTGPPTVGGLELASYYLAIAASRRPHWHALLLNGTPPDKAQNEYRLKQEVIAEISTEHTCNRRVYRALLSGRRHPLLASMANRLYHALDRHLRPGDVLVSFNVLSAHYNPALTLALQRVTAERPDVRHLAWAFDLNDRLLQPQTLSTRFLWTEFWTPSQRTTYCACSSPVAERLGAALHLPTSSIHVIPPGTDVSACLQMTQRAASVWRARLTNAWPILFMPARISARKNLGKALAMMCCLRRRLPRAQLVIAGALSPHDETARSRLAALRRLRTSRGLGDAVTFLTTDDHSRTPATFADCMSMMAIADAVLLTSDAEGFLIPVLEAALHRVTIYAPALSTIRSWATALARLYPVGLGPRDLATWITGRIRRDASHACHVVRQQHSWEVVLERHILPLAGRAR
jgi:glycosyltransferase involved in cell wall biosynthesis